MHAGAGVRRERLGHEGGIDTLFERDLLHDQAEGHDVVGRGERVGVAQVDLLLTWCALVVAELHRDAHRLEHRDRLATEVVALPVRAVVEVAHLVDGGGLLAGRESRLQEEELDLGVGVEAEAELGRLVERALEHVAGVGVRRAAVGHEDVAEHPPGARALPAPRQHLEGARVGLGEHVGLVDPGEALDRRTVEPDALGEGTLELCRGDRHRLEHAEHVGEPQPDEPDVTLFDRAQHELRLLVHADILS